MYMYVYMYICIYIHTWCRVQDAKGRGDGGPFLKKLILLGNLNKGSNSNLGEFKQGFKSKFRKI